MQSKLSKLKREIGKLRSDLVIPELREYLDFDREIFIKKLRKSKNEVTDEEKAIAARTIGFIRYKFDKLRLKIGRDNDYMIVFNFLDIGENILYKK